MGEVKWEEAQQVKRDGDDFEDTQSNNKWCKNIHSLLKSIGMEDTWNKNTLTRKEAKNWRYTVKEKIQEREELQWKERMQHKPNYEHTDN